MASLTLQRQNSTDQGTAGVLLAADGSILCYTMELPWRDNQRGLSCIPAGQYRASYLERSASGRFRDIYLLHGVPGRSAILIHSGNYAGDSKLGLRTHTWGCILPCSKHGVLAGQFAGLASKRAKNQLMAYTGRQEITITVEGEVWNG